MNLQQRMDAFARLGYFMQHTDSKSNTPDFLNDNEKNAFEALQLEVVDACHYNGWFIEANVRQALTSLGDVITSENLHEWLLPYHDKLTNNPGNRTIGLVMAGNVPAVGFHDWMSVLLSGNNVLAKLSSDDHRLIPALSNLLLAIEPEFTGKITFTRDQLKGFDAIIATGSNNSARYFEYYFGKYPHIIRKNRNGVAILSGTETADELSLLTDDIFTYYGMGCRNVAHVFVPLNYDFTALLDACQQWTPINENHKYFNNYEYNKAIYLVNSTPHFDAGNLLLTENNALASPVSVLHYEYYQDIITLNESLLKATDQIQCIIANQEEITSAIPFGTSQKPALWDYADGVDTMEFLLGL